MCVYMCVFNIYIYIYCVFISYMCIYIYIYSFCVNWKYLLYTHSHEGKCSLVRIKQIKTCFSCRASDHIIGGLAAMHVKASTCLAAGHRHGWVHDRVVSSAWGSFSPTGRSLGGGTRRQPKLWRFQVHFWPKPKYGNSLPGCFRGGVVLVPSVFLKLSSLWYL